MGKIVRNGIEYSASTSDYSEAINKPQINGVTLVGNKTLAAFGIASSDYVDDTVNYKVGVAIERMQAYTDSAIEDITDFESEAFPNG